MRFEPKAPSGRGRLKRSAATGTACAVGSGHVAGSSAARVMEVAHIRPATMAALIQKVRGAYPHDHVADEYCAIAVKGCDAEGRAPFVEAGSAALDAVAQGAGFVSHLGTGCERDRVVSLRGMMNSVVFQSIRGGLVARLDNRKSVWPLFGNEGVSVVGLEAGGRNLPESCVNDERVPPGQPAGKRLGATRTNGLPGLRGCNTYTVFEAVARAMGHEEVPTGPMAINSVDYDDRLACQ